MISVEARFRLLAEAVRTGSAIDRSALLDGLTPAEMLELEDLVDGFLSARRSLPADRDLFEQARRNDPVIERFGRSVSGSSGLWPSTLPRLRAERSLARDELIERLRESLGDPQGGEKIATYYHRMEWGSLPAAGVNTTVTDALAEILEIDADELRSAGDPVVAPGDQVGDARFGMGLPDPPRSPGAFARMIDTADLPPSPDGVADHLDEGGWDETDRLFLGG